MTLYFDEEKGNRHLGSPEADLLEEVVDGVREYFEMCVGRILLYRFERQQYFESRQLWESGKGEWAGKNAADCYGAEHLCRLFGKTFIFPLRFPPLNSKNKKANNTSPIPKVSLPELVAQTNMDQQSVNKLRMELSLLTNWLSNNSQKFFVSEYISASQDYIEKARG